MKSPLREKLRPSFATAPALTICLVFFASVLYYAHKKYLCQDVTHFDVQRLVQFFESVRSEGFIDAMNLNPDDWFYYTFEPAQLITIPFYLLAPSAYTLFVLQAGTLSVALFFAYLLAAHVSNNRKVGLAALVACALNPYLWTFALMGWRSYLITAPFFVASLYAVEKKNNKLAAVLLALGGLGKVNLMLLSACIGLWIWLRNPKAKHAKRAFVTCFILLVLIIAAATAIRHRLDLDISTEEMHLSAYGDTIGKALFTVATSPLLVMRQIFVDANIAHPAMFLSLLFIPVCAGGYFLCALPEIGLILLSTSGLTADVFYRNIYPAIYNPNVFVHNNHFYLTGILLACFAVGLARIYNYFSKNSFGMMNGPYMILSVVFLSFVIRFIWPPMIAGPMPLNIHYDGRYYRQTAHDKLGWRMAEDIPEGAFVRAQWSLFSKTLMKGHPRLRSFEWYRNDVVEDYIYVDLFAFEYLMERRQYLSDLARILKGGRYGVMRFKDGYVLMKKGGDTGENLKVLEFIEDNGELLLKNLFRPYRDRALPDPQVGRDVYSKTQLVGQES